MPRIASSGNPEVYIYSGKYGTVMTRRGRLVPIGHLALLGDLNNDGKVEFLATSTGVRNCWVKQ